ncbi:MAG: hypothetical protein A3I77_02550 [Gammaproteobacteria bacterium RIFCSPLOWO2_02_FULL_42_14]|nr:MAG: hypothetical protein A3B71_02390 [Gammaproteobacteria bacterium RIFCSPHIGHO2_02_FULL_42_43]OGT53532.1 MAG: hypothetical protein A3E54_02415 [Gammaproteobacteria bacterium RIFCSPHIGHO2_12_FULL_41_25]OGT61476.1 MAG: hypothetical protein A3I77_02550 [Gammaproteobacteria bacterium RIFCSPLOWO2_02_FULL_42_14]OGT86756.1 MAG: hypothetical protein A3G86_05330 [Gammaproteobacteria bacterium RIFCSPLOWO2_12_FULL_42_18]
MGWIKAKFAQYHAWISPVISVLRERVGNALDFLYHTLVAIPVRFIKQLIQKISQKVQSWLAPITQHYTTHILPIYTYYKNQCKENTQEYWKAVREIRIKNKTVGDVVDVGVAKINEHPWIRQLQDASKLDTRFPTMISTLFANLLAIIFPLSLMQVYDRIIPNHTTNTLLFLTLIVVSAIALEAALRIIRTYINLWADTKYEFYLGKTAFSKIMNAPLHIAENTDVGTRLEQFAILDQMKGFYNTQLLTAMYEVPFLLIFVFVIAYIGEWLFIIPLITIIFSAYLMWKFALRWEFLLREKLTFEARENDFIINVLTGIHTAKSIGMEELLLRRHERLQESGMKIDFLSSIHDGDLLTIKSTASQGTIILTATFGCIMVVYGHLAIGGLAACILLAGRIMRPFDRILTTFNRLNMINLVREKLDVIFQLPSEENVTTGETVILKGEIKLEKISFHFDDFKEYEILKALDLRIPPNTLVGICGDDQTEKTTLLNILSTVTKPTSGQYFLDDKDVHQYQTSALRKQIAYLKRTGKLFRGSIMDNLSAFDEKLIPMARRLVDRLGLNTILSKLPSGYDTFVGEKAVEALPGGVVNLILIIRALVRKPKIVLFDETNINLDTQSKQKMLELLPYLKEFSTIVVLVMQESTMKIMDVIYRFEEGKLVRVENFRPEN